MKNTTYYKLKRGKLIPAEESELDELKGNNLLLGFKYENSDKDLGIHFQVRNYSIGITYKEFMQIYDEIKDKEALIAKVLARRI